MDIEYLEQEVQVAYGPRQLGITTRNLIMDLIRRKIVEEGRYLFIYHNNLGLIEIEGFFQAYQGLTNLVYILRNDENVWVRVTKNWDLYFLLSNSFPTSLDYLQMIGPLVINENTPISYSRTMYNPLGGYARMDIEYLEQEVQVAYGPRQLGITTRNLIMDLIRRKIVEKGRYLFIYHNNLGLIEIEGFLQAYQGLTNLVYILRNDENVWVRVTKDWDLYFLLSNSFPTSLEYLQMIGPLVINESTPISFSRTMYNPLGGYARMDIEYLQQEVQVVYGPRQYGMTTRKLIMDLIRRKIVEEGRYLFIYHNNLGLIEIEGLLQAYQGLTNLVQNGEDVWVVTSSGPNAPYPRNSNNH